LRHEFRLHQTLIAFSSIYNS